MRDITGARARPRPRVMRSIFSLGNFVSGGLRERVGLGSMLFRLDDACLDANEVHRPARLFDCEPLPDARCVLLRELDFIGWS